MTLNEIRKRMTEIQLWRGIFGDDPGFAVVLWDLCREYDELRHELVRAELADLVEKTGALIERIAIQLAAEIAAERAEDLAAELDDPRPLRESTTRGALPPFQWEAPRPCRHPYRVKSTRRGCGGDGDRTQWERTRSRKRRVQRKHKNG